MAGEACAIPDCEACSRTNTARPRNTGPAWTVHGARECTVAPFSSRLSSKLLTTLLINITVPVSRFAASRAAMPFLQTGAPSFPRRSAVIQGAVSRKLFAGALVQCDNLSKELQANIRVDWIHTPGSDLFLVLDTNSIPATSVIESPGAGRACAPAGAPAPVIASARTRTFPAATARNDANRALRVFTMGTPSLAGTPAPYRSANRPVNLHARLAQGALTYASPPPEKRP